MHTQQPPYQYDPQEGSEKQPHGESHSGSNDAPQRLTLSPFKARMARLEKQRHAKLGDGTGGKALDHPDQGPEETGASIEPSKKRPKESKPKDKKKKSAILERVKQATRLRAVVQTGSYLFVFLTFGLVNGAIGPMLPVLATNVDTDMESMGLVFTAKGCGGILGSIIAGKAFDFLSARSIKATNVFLSLCLVLMAFSTMLLSLQSVFWLLIVSSIMFGVFMGIVNIGCNVLTVWIWREMATPWLLLLSFCAGIGSFLSPLLLSALSSTGIVLPTMVISGCIVAATIALLLVHVFIPLVMSTFMERKGVSVDKLKRQISREMSKSRGSFRRKKRKPSTLTRLESFESQDGETMFRIPSQEALLGTPMTPTDMTSSTPYSTETPITPYSTSSTPISPAVERGMTISGFAPGVTSAELAAVLETQGPRRKQRMNLTFRAFMGKTRVARIAMILGVIMFGLVGLESSFSGILVTYMKTSRAQTFESESNLMVSMFWLALSLGRLSASVLSHFTRPSMVLAVSAVMVFLVQVALLLLPVHHIIIWIGTILFGLALSSQFPTAMCYPESSMRNVQISAKMTAIMLVMAAMAEMTIPLVITNLFRTDLGASSLFLVLGSVSLMTLFFYAILFTITYFNNKNEPEMVHLTDTRAHTVVEAIRDVPLPVIDEEKVGGVVVSRGEMKHSASALSIDMEHDEPFKEEATRQNSMDITPSTVSSG